MPFARGLAYCFRDVAQLPFQSVLGVHDQEGQRKKLSLQFQCEQARSDSFDYVSLQTLMSVVKKQRNEIASIFQDEPFQKEWRILFRSRSVDPAESKLGDGH